MSIDARIADDQPDSFAFNKENEAEIKRIIAKYPKGRQASAVMPLLDMAQRQHDNWIYRGNDKPSVCDACASRQTDRDFV